MRYELNPTEKSIVASFIYDILDRASEVFTEKDIYVAAKELGVGTRVEGATLVNDFIEIETLIWEIENHKEAA